MHRPAIGHGGLRTLYIGASLRGKGRTELVRHDALKHGKNDHRWRGRFQRAVGTESWHSALPIPSALVNIQRVIKIKN